MPDHCPKCGAECAPDFSFCGNCGAPLGACPVVVRHDQNRTYYEDVETTIDLEVENAGREPLRKLFVEVGSLGRGMDELAPGARSEICISGFRPPANTEAMVLPISISGPVNLAGEFKIRVRRRKSKSVQVVGNNNIVDMARIGAPVERPRESRWTVIALHPEARTDRIPDGTPLLVKDGDEEQTLELNTQSISFGRRKETNQVLVRVPGNDQKAVDRISRDHFSILLRKGELRLRDTSSKGTLVNGKAVREATLHDGDVVSLAGAAEFRIILERDGGRIGRAILERTQ